MKVKLEIVVVVFFSHLGGHLWYKTNVVIKAKKDQEEWKLKNSEVMLVKFISCMQLLYCSNH